MKIRKVRKDIIGHVYGSLTVVKEIGIHDKGGYLLIECLCDCGVTVNVRKINLGSGNTRSCGANIHRAGNNTIHGLTKHRLYWILAGMKRRCYYKKDKSYKDYGGRGIKVCEEWMNNIPAFVEWGIKNGWVEGLEIDRKNVNSNYEPFNCHFVTKLVNMQNTRRTKTVVYNGKAQSLKELSEFTGICYGTLWDRIFKEKIGVEESVNKSNTRCSKPSAI